MGLSIPMLWSRGLDTSWRWVLRGLAPECCPVCAEPVAPYVATQEEGVLCGRCWRRVDFISEPMCPKTGMPFPYAMGLGAVSAAGLATGSRALAFDRSRGAVVYRGAGRDLVLRFKHGARADAGRVLARWMLMAGAEALSGVDWVVATPTSLMRALRRGGWDPVGDLARRVARGSDRSWAAGALRLVRSRPKQGAVGSQAARWRNMRGAFVVAERWRARMDGAKVAVIDDVMTTGATLSACARALRRAGAAEVVGLVAAITPLGRGMP